MNFSSVIQTNNFDYWSKKFILTFFIPYKIVTKSFITKIVSQKFIFMNKIHFSVEISWLSHLEILPWKFSMALLLILQIHNSTDTKKIYSILDRWSETPQKKGQWALHAYGIANFVASGLKWLQMIWNDSKWVSMCLKNQLKPIGFI